MTKILIIISLIVCFILGACATTPVSAKQEHPLKIWPHNSNWYMHTWHVEDEETGVNYVVVSTERGNGEMTVAIIPRLNADGTLYVSP